jgi:hypothetical protein
VAVGPLPPPPQLRPGAINTSQAMRFVKMEFIQRF